MYFIGGNIRKISIEIYQQPYFPQLFPDLNITKLVSLQYGFLTKR